MPAQLILQIRPDGISRKAVKMIAVMLLAAKSLYQRHRGKALLGNGTVDAADYVVWQSTLGQSDVDPGSGADGDKSGHIGTADYDIWRTQFGTAAPATGGSISAVPEPYAVSLAIVGFGIVLTRYRLRRRMEYLTHHPIESPATSCRIPAWFDSSI
jgi:hypothetical protein